MVVFLIIEDKIMAEWRKVAKAFALESGYITQ
jgi:hypothetical protein